MTRFLFFSYICFTPVLFAFFRKKETPSTATHIQAIRSIAAQSNCRRNWQGDAPPEAFTSGMAVTFAKSFCRLEERQPAALEMSQANTERKGKDALAHYEDRLRKNKVNIDEAGSESLKATYTLGVGLGMVESGGKYCEGYNVKAGSKRASDEAEAGPFQSSLSSVNGSDELQTIFDEYSADTSGCLLPIFAQGIECTPRKIIGSGEGAEFQKLAKSCPAFATEYAMLSLRVVRTHYGTINVRSAEINPGCEQMFDQVQHYVESDRKNACRELL